MEKRVFTTKNGLALFLAFCMLIQSVFTNVSITAWASQDNKDASAIVLTGVETRNKDGKVLETGSKVELAEPIVLRYMFRLTDSAQTGDRLEFGLPSQIGIFSPLNFNVSGDGGEKFAKISIDTEGTVSITLLSAVEHMKNMEGWFDIETFWKITDLESERPETLTFQIGDKDVTVVLNVKLSKLEGDVKVEKKGKYQAQDGSVLWTVKVTPETKPIPYPLRNVVVTDFIQQDQILDQDSYEIFAEKDSGDSQVFSRAAFGLTLAAPKASESDAKQEPASPSEAASPVDFEDCSIENDLIDDRSLENVAETSEFPQWTEVEESMKDGFHYSGDDPVSPRVLTYTFPTGISEPYIIQYRTRPNSAEMDPGQFSQDGRSYSFSNQAKVSLPKNVVGDAVGENLKVVTGNIARAEYPIEYISKDGHLIDDSSEIQWTVDVNKSHMTVKNAVIQDRFNPGLNEENRFLDLVEDSVTYQKDGGTPEPLTLCDQVKTVTVSGKETVVCSHQDKSHYTYDSQKKVICYALGDIDTHGVLRYSTVIDQEKYIAASSPEIENGIALGGEGGWYSGKGPAVIQPEKGWINKKGIGYDPSTHQITWQAVINGMSQNLTAAKFEDILVTDSNDPNGQKYVAGSFQITEGGTFESGKFGFSEDTVNQKQTLTYDFGNISAPYTVQFVTELVKKDYESNIPEDNERRYSNTATLTATYFGKEITAPSTGYQKIISTVLKKTALDYNYATRVIQWEIEVNSNKTPIVDAVVTDTLPEELEFVKIESDGSITALTAGNAGDGIQWDGGTAPAGSTVNLSSSGNESQLTINYSGTMQDSSKFKIAARIKDDKYKELFAKDNGKITLVNNAELAGTGFNPVIVTSDKEVTNTILGKEAVYESGEDFVTWRVLINQHRQAIPLEPGTEIGTVCLSDTLQKGLILDIDSVNLYQINTQLPDNGVYDWDKVLNTPGQAEKKDISLGKYDSQNKTASGNACYDTAENKFRFFLAPGADNGYNIEPISNDTILEGKTYLLVFNTDISPDMIKSGAVDISNSIGMEGAGFSNDTPSDSVKGASYSNGNGGGTGRKGAIRIIKKDRYRPSVVLEGGTFSLEDAAVRHEPLKLDPVSAVTDTKGETLFPMLYYELEYQLKEIEAPVGYLDVDPGGTVILPDQTSGGVTVDQTEQTISLKKSGLTGGVLEIQVLNTPKLGWIEMRKKSSNTEQALFLNGAVMGVYYAKDTPFGKANTLAKMVVEDENGQKKELDAKLATENRNSEPGWVRFDGLRCGDYYLKEITAPGGYKLSDEKLYFRIDPDKATEGGTEPEAEGSYYDSGFTSIVPRDRAGILIDHPIGIIEILKKDFVTDSAVQGAEFALYTSFQNAENGTSPVLSGIKEKNGKITAENLSEGIYYLKETKLPSNYGYVTDKDNGAEKERKIYKVELKGLIDTSGGTPRETLTLYQYESVDSNLKTELPDNKIEIFNMPRGSFTLTKKDAYNGNLLSGAKIKLTLDSLSDPDHDRSTFVNNGTESTVTTGSNGKAVFSNLPYGTYTWEEIAPPDGYVYMDSHNGNQNPEPHTGTFTVSEEDGKRYQSRELKNRPILMDYQFEKIDNSGNPVPGVVFGLYLDETYQNPAQNEAVGNRTNRFVSDENGIVTIPFLREGTYYFREENKLDYFENTAKGSFTVTANDSAGGGSNDKKIVTGPDVVNWKTDFVTIQKVDSRTGQLIKFPAKFEIVAVEGDQSGEETTGDRQFKKQILTENGSLTMELKEGWYRYREMEPPRGYTYLGDDDENTWTYFEVKQKEDQTIQVKNRLFPVFNLEVTKTGEPGNRPLPGAEITVFDGAGRIVETVTTDKNGIALFENLVCSEDSVDNYYFKETKAPEGYEIHDGDVWFHMTDDKTDRDKILEMVLHNELKRGSFRFYKTDSSLEANPIPGALFQLTYKGKGTSGAENPWDEKGKTIPATSGNNGLVSFDNLPLGIYTCKEIKAPAGYHLEKDWEYEVLLTSDDRDKTYLDEDGNEIFMVNFGLYKGRLEVSVTDGEGKTLPGAKIGVYLASDNQKLGEAVTGKDGMVSFEDLYEGEYYFKEIEAPDGYYSDEKEYSFTIDTNGQTVHGDIINRKIEKGSFRLLKHKRGTEVALAGAVISLYLPDGTPVAEKETGEDGIALFTDLLLGEYYWEETKAPEGYVRDKERHQIEIKTDQEVVASVLENSEINHGSNGGGSRPSPSVKPDDSAVGPGNSSGGQTGDPSTGIETTIDPEKPETWKEMENQVQNTDLAMAQETDGSTTISIPDTPPNTEYRISNSQNEIVYRGSTDDDGKIRVDLPADSYILMTLDENGVPMAQFMFQIGGEDIPYAALPKTGDPSEGRALRETLLWALLAGTLALIFRKKKKFL